MAHYDLPHQDLHCLKIQLFLSLEDKELIGVPYFFGYKTEIFSFKINPKDLDPSCKMDLDLWDCLERVKFVL